MAFDLQEFSRILFRAADELWTNTVLRPDQYAQPAVALIAKFEAVEAELGPRYIGSLKPAPADYQTRGTDGVKDSSQQRANANQ